MCIELEITHPVVHFIVLPRPKWIGDLVLGVISISQVLHDRTTLEDSNGLAIGESVCDGRDTAVGVDLQEPGLFLGVLADLDISHLFISQPSGSSTLHLDLYL